MPEEVTQEALDQQAQGIADLLDDLPWCECTGYLVVEDDEEEDQPLSLNEYLQAFDVQVYDGYVTDYMRLVKGLHDSLAARIESEEIAAHLTVDYGGGEDPNLVPLALMVNFYGHDEDYLVARRAVLDSFENLVRQAVEEWSREEDEEEAAETLA